MALSKDEILAQLAKILNEVADVEPDSVTRDKRLQDDLDIDSLSVVEIAMATEEELHVQIPDDQLSRLKTVGQVVDYIYEHQPL